MVDFEAHDVDELGFRKNDIIKVSLSFHRYIHDCLHAYRRCNVHYTNIML